MDCKAAAEKIEDIEKRFPAMCQELETMLENHNNGTCPQDHKSLNEIQTGMSNIRQAILELKEEILVRRFKQL